MHCISLLLGVFTYGRSEMQFTWKPFNPWLLEPISVFTPTILHSPSIPKLTKNTFSVTEKSTSTNSFYSVNCNVKDNEYSKKRQLPAVSTKQPRSYAWDRTIWDCATMMLRSQSTWSPTPDEETTDKSDTLNQRDISIEALGCKKGMCLSLDLGQR